MSPQNTPLLLLVAVSSRVLADAIGWRFIEGDTLHSPANIEKMSAGIPLVDADRWPVLEAVANELLAFRSTGVVLSCSALKLRYRQLLRGRVADLVFVLPVLDRERLVKRHQQRAGHFLPAALLDSQLADFEMPESGEGVVLVDGAAALDEVCASVLAALAAMPRIEGQIGSDAV